MKSAYLILILLISFVLSSFQFTYGQKNEQQPFYNMSNKQIDSLLKEISKKHWTITQKMDYYSRRFLGTPYNFSCVGDGPYAIMEPYPLVNFKETNCMSFCEHVLALSISDYWDTFFDNLQNIRYKDGLIGMRTRNHYTMADWLPQNHWLLHDVTRQVGGAFTKKITRTISHRRFFAEKGIKDMTDVLPDRTLTIDYIPLDKLDEVENNLKVGDVCAIIDGRFDNIFSAHMLMIMENKGKKVIRESTTRGMTTFDTPYRQWVKMMQTKYKDKYLGLAIMRVHDELNTPGRIIKPWDIPRLKKQFGKRK